uniref:Histone deacetylase n=1 Tax=Solanum tuberosum TaxID=4113 RepID=M1CXR0_SOLTU
MSSTASSSKTDDAEALRRHRILSSHLYYDVPPSKVPLIYSPSYDIAFFGIEKLHPFDSSKWGRICRFLTKEGIMDQKHVVEPVEATKDDLLVVATSTG